MTIRFEEAQTKLVADLEIYRNLLGLLDLARVDQRIRIEATNALAVAGELLAKSLNAFVDAAREKGIKPVKS
jgi:hypothetical protein